MKAIVVGSGPAGISAAKGLLERGCEVILLDAGNTLEQDKKTLLHQVQQTDCLMNINRYRHHANGKKNLKLPYGSNFIYDGVKDYFSWSTKRCYFQPSFARGGLSNVWGGAIAQYTENELSNWPARCRDLSTFYVEMISSLGHYYTADTETVLSKQACYLKHHWEKEHHLLKQNGFLFSTPTLAIDFKHCRFCASCQYGCPYELIYKSEINLILLKTHENFKYVTDVIVENFYETEQQIELIVNNKKTKQVQKIFAERLFIACGAGLSSLLYLRSLNKPNKELRLQDSQHFLLPCVINQRIKDVSNEPMHTLCQLNLSLTQQAISSYPIYLQLYTYMDLYLHEMKKKFKFLYPLVKPLSKSWLERLVVMQGYMDSRESNHLIIQYQKSGHFIINKSYTTAMKSTLNNIVQHLYRFRSHLAIKPLRFLTSLSLTGQSNHVGGSLPMSDNPKEDEVDIWGRPNHFRRIHFVDGSILPSIPAGPITLTIMANAYRIAKEGPL